MRFSCKVIPVFIFIVLIFSGGDAVLCNQENLPHIFCYDTFPGKIALTFDDGPDPYYTATILDILKKNNVKATFFVMGAKVEAYPELTKRIVEEGHTLGNHTYTHINMRAAGLSTIEYQLDRTDEAVDEVLGYHYEMSTMRPPFGEYNYSILDFVEKKGKSLIMWQIDSYDCRGYSASKILNRVLYLYGKGGVVLYHDCCSASMKSLQNVIDVLKEKGCRFVTMEDILLFKQYSVKDGNNVVFNGKPLGENCLFVMGRPYINVDFFSEISGVDFIKVSDRQLVFHNRYYDSMEILGKTYISSDILVRDFGLSLQERGENKTELYYPVISFDGDRAEPEDAFIYEREIYFSLDYLKKKTGMDFKWIRQKSSVSLANKEVEGKVFFGRPFLSQSSLGEFGLLEIKNPRFNLVEMKFTEVIINDNFAPVNSYRDREKNCLMVSLNDVREILGFDYEVRKDGKISVCGNEIDVCQKGKGIYISMDGIKEVNEMKIYENMTCNIISLLGLKVFSLITPPGYSCDPGHYSYTESMLRHL